MQFAPLAQRITAIRGFDLDHLCPEFGQNARAERPGDQRAEFENLDIG